MKVSGREIAQSILDNLQREISQNNLKPGLAIILAGPDPSSAIYVQRKIEKATEVGINANLYKFSEDQKNECLQKIEQLNQDSVVHGIIVQYPIFDSWDFDELAKKVALEKDVDGFLEGSLFFGATAQAVWEMLKKFASIEGLSIENFLQDKKMVILGKGKAAGKPTINLLKARGYEPIIVDSKTPNPDEVIISADIVISATGKRHIVNGSNIKIGAYVIGVGVGREDEKTFGDINEIEVSEKAKLYCPTIGGIGPLTVACLLKNVTESALQSQSSRT